MRNFTDIVGFSDREYASFSFENTFKWNWLLDANWPLYVAVVTTGRQVFFKESR